jgi:glycosyltransferase involved in cell wall biosynthesis
MKFALLTKRYYTNKDILDDRFGRLFHLPDQLGKLGHEGLVITGDLHGNRDEKRRINGLDYYSKPLSLPGLYGFFNYSYQLLKKERPQVLISSGDSYWGYLGLRLARKLRIPFVFDVYDDYTAWKANWIPGMKSLFYHAVKNADLIVASGKPLEGFLSVYNESVIVIENGFDPEIFRPIPRGTARAQCGIPENETVIGYFGTLRSDLGIDVLIEATRLVRRKHPELRLLLAGHNSTDLDFDSRDFIDYRGVLPQEMLPALINSCDVAVIPYLLTRITEMCNACKCAEYLACKVPVVVTKVSDFEDVFSGTPEAVCEPGNAEIMAVAINRQLKQRRLTALPENLIWRNLADKLAVSMGKLNLPDNF